MKKCHTVVDPARRKRRRRKDNYLKRDWNKQLLRVKMGWFKTIFGRREEKVEKEKPLSVNFTELNDLLNKELEKQSKPFYENIRKEYFGIQTVIKQLENNMETLSKIEIKMGVDSRERHVILAHRSSFINKINNMLNAFKIPTDINYESAIDFYNSSAKALNYASVKSLSDFGHIKIPFKKEALEIVNDMKRLDYQLKSLGSLIDIKEEFFTNVENSFTDMKNLKEMFVVMSHNKNEMKDFENKLTKSKKMRKTYDNHIKTLLKSDEYLKLNNLKRKIKNVENEIDKINNDIIQTVSPFRRAFKKFKKLVDDEIQPFTNKKCLELYIERPVVAVVNDDDLKTLNLVLTKVQESILSNKIQMKSREKEKTLNKINEMIGNKNFESIVRNLKTLISKKQIIEKNLASIKTQEKKDELEKKLVDIDNEIEAIITKKQDLNDRIEKLKNEINEGIIEFEKRLKIITNRVVIIKK